MILETLKNKNVKLEIFQEEYYSINDFLFINKNEIFISNVPRYLQSFNTDKDFSDFESIQDIIDYFKNDDNQVYLVNAYIHSGFALSLGSEYPFNCQWDSGLGGILVLPKEYSAKSYINEFNLLLDGSVYGYTVERLETCKCCNNVNSEVIESLGYIVANDRQCLKDSLLDNLINEDAIKLVNEEY